MEPETAEEWKVIPSFPDYEISSLGVVRRLTRAKRTWVGRVLTNSTNHDGYLSVKLTKDKKEYGRLVHVLVAEAFIGPKPPGMEVNHKDSCRSNPNLTNLEYCTHSQNMQHSADSTGGTRGELSSRATCTEASVREIRSMHKNGMKISDISRAFGMNYGTVSSIIHRKTWAWMKDDSD